MKAALAIIELLATQSFIFTSFVYDVDSESFEFVMDKRLRLIKTINRVLADAVFPNATSNSIIKIIMTMPQSTKDFDLRIFEMHCQGLIGDMQVNANTHNINLVKYHAWQRMTVEMVAWIKRHMEHLKALPSNQLNEFAQIILRFLYAPFTATKYTAIMVS